MDSELIKEINATDQNFKHNETKIETTNLPLKSILIFLVATLLTSIVLEFVPEYNSKPTCTSIYSSSVNRSFAIYGKSSKEDHLVHVINMLERFGYKRTTLDDEWNLLWAHDYPFLSMPQVMKNLLPHQIVNHFPGCGFITNKVDLSTSNLPFLPRSFKLPSQKEQFLRYAQENPQALFVEKHNEHRYISIRSPSTVKLNSNDSFVQEYIQNPLLVDGYKFDIGIYVVLTSINPLRVYLYTSDVLFRYCTKKYYPFDPSDVDKYVVGDDYLPTWKVPSLSKYYNKFSGNMRGAFEAYLYDHGMNSSGIWLQVENIIRETIRSKESHIANVLRSYKTKNFFDLIRFDLLITDDLKVYLLEANMSPNLSSAHFKANAILYEQILYSVLNLVGIGTSVKTTQSSADEFITIDSNLATNLNECAQHNCDSDCNQENCNLCLPCWTGEEYNILQKSHREHLHRINMKRIIPVPISDPARFDLYLETQNDTESNKWLTKWFYYKCKFDRSWCT